MIKAVFFDLDDTLLWDQKSVKEAFASTCRYASEKVKVDPEELEKAVRNAARELYSSYDTYEFTQKIGINPFEGLWGNFLDEDENFVKLKNIVPTYRKDAWIRGLLDLGIDNILLGEELAEIFPEERRKKPFIYDETFRVLEQLKGKYKLLLLTNGSPDLQNTKLEITPEISPYFDEIIISGAFGIGKPDISIFQHALKTMSISKEEAIMVGDNLMTDILGASRAGIQSVWVNRHKKKSGDIQPDFEINKLDEVLSVLEKIESL